MAAPILAYQYVPCPRISKNTVETRHDIEALRQDSEKEVERVTKPLSYEDFFLRFLLPNKPCILSGWATQHWRSRQEWVSDGHPDLTFLQEEFGSATVPVADCGREMFSSHPKTDMSFSEYLQYWRSRGVGGEDRLLYLKDWHFARTFPEYRAYETPVYFRSDWLNEFWDCRTGDGDDYRFVYMGPKGTWTPLHADVFRSYSWSANICGRKKWIFFPPGEEKCLTDVYGQLAYSAISEELKDQSKFPYYKNLRHQIEVYQEEGEIIFVPSGWHHQVFNVEDTISINHNWLNGCNVDVCWHYIKKCLGDVEREISDCRDMEGWSSQCQLILKASSGIDYKQFLRFLITVAQHRLQALAKSPIGQTLFAECKNNNGQKSQPCRESCKDNSSCDRNNCGVGRTCDHQHFNSVNPVISHPENASKGKEVELLNKPCVEHCTDVAVDPGTKGLDMSSGENTFDHTSCDLHYVDLDDLDTERDHVLDLGSQCPIQHPYIHWRYCSAEHCVFDLKRLQSVMGDILQTLGILDIGAEDEIKETEDIIAEIKHILK